MKFQLLVGLLLAQPVLASPPVYGSEDELIMRDYKEWIISQHTSNGSWCCDISDGRPLQSDEVRQHNGQYQILFSKYHWPDVGTDTWIDVPDRVILHVANPTGLTIAWVGHNGFVYCLSLTSGV